MCQLDCLAVDADTVVFDNLIHKKEMPVTIGIFINPGNIPATKDGAQARNKGLSGGVGLSPGDHARTFARLRGPGIRPGGKPARQSASAVARRAATPSAATWPSRTDR